MSNYVNVPIEVDQQDVVQDAYDYIQGRVDGWEPATGNLDTIIIEATSEEAAELREVASEVTTTIFRYYGATLMGIEPIYDTPAIAYTTWTVQDNLGYTIDAGTIVGYRTAEEELLTFETFEAVTIPPGQTATTVGQVLVTATDPGQASSGLGGPGAAMELVDPISWVTGVTMAGISSGGTDAESDDDYLNRLVSRLQLMSDTLVLPRDFQLAAMSVPGVGRTLVLDGYNPANQTFNNERMIAVAVVDANGEPVSTTVKNELDTVLENSREINFIVNIMDPTYTLIDVTFAAKARPGFIPADVELAAEAAVRDYLSPNNWGTSIDEPREWVRVTAVRYLEIATVINNVDGIDYVTTLTLNIDGQAPGTADLTLPGNAPMPRPETINGTVSA